MSSFRTQNPTTESFIQEYTYWKKADLNRSLEESRHAFSLWKTHPLKKRLILFENLVLLLEREKEELSIQMTLEMGKPIRESRAEIEKCVWLVRYYIDHAQEFLSPQMIESDASSSFLRFDPLGTIFGIMPWNFPFWQVFRCAIPAMIAGNAFMLKHATNVMGSACALEKLFLEAGFTRGLFTNAILTHEDAAEVISHPQIGGVALTGSVGAGSAVAKIAGAAIKPCVLELGGSDAFIVMEDADLDAAAEAGVFSRMLNNGQSCIAAKRFLIQDSVYESFLEKMAHYTELIQVGDPLLEDTQMGPMARNDLLEDIRGQVFDTLKKGAKIYFEKTFESKKGYFFSPSLIRDVLPHHRMFQEEVFGPSASLTSFSNLEEAIRLTNQSEFGLGASLWTESKIDPSVFAKIDVGYLAINGFVKSDPRLPFGGTKKSGFGRELSELGLLEFVNKKTIWIR